MDECKPLGGGSGGAGDARVLPLPSSETGAGVDAPVRCVCVVGLAHCNGLVARLSEMDLEGC